jgi:hypothetical protein
LIVGERITQSGKNSATDCLLLAAKMIFKKLVPSARASSSASARRHAAPSCDQRRKKRDPTQAGDDFNETILQFTWARFAQFDPGPRGWMNGLPDDGTFRYNRSAVREIAAPLSGRIL